MIAIIQQKNGEQPTKLRILRGASVIFILQNMV